MVMKYVNWVIRREVDEPEIPVCPDHGVPMRLRGTFGKPARFNRQTEEVYTRIYFCPVEGCNDTELRETPYSQAPFPGEAPGRPIYARKGDR